MRWPLRKRFWKWLHGRLNGLAWRYGMEPGWRMGMHGAALHIRHDHWTWRLNDWAARHWTDWWMRAVRRRTR